MREEGRRSSLQLGWTKGNERESQLELRTEKRECVDSLLEVRHRFPVERRQEGGSALVCLGEETSSIPFSLGQLLSAPLASPTPP